MRKRVLLGYLLVIFTTLFISCSNEKNVVNDVQKLESKNYAIQDNMIVFPEPERVEGQKSVLQLAVDPSPVVRM